MNTQLFALWCRADCTAVLPLALVVKAQGLALQQMVFCTGREPRIVPQRKRQSVFDPLAFALKKRAAGEGTVQATGVYCLNGGWVRTSSVWYVVPWHSPIDSGAGFH